VLLQPSHIAWITCNSVHIIGPAVNTLGGKFLIKRSVIFKDSGLTQGVHDKTALFLAVNSRFPLVSRVRPTSVGSFPK